ncbi:putative F-box protein At1g49610 [Nicotiana tomentosiformis]|uniref:putative F-box protein At1g49610 n=1 Tax=Nicotiana tomentosiformis TaxID=4098 RepID=UPI00388CD3D5
MRRKATADILPECVIHKILSYLSYEEATHMRILSKTWLQAWLTHPKLEFTFDFHKGNMKIVDKVMERYGETKIPIDKFELWMFSSKSRCGEVFPLIDKWIDIALQNGAKDLVYRDTSSTDPLYPLPIFTILAAKSLTKLVLTRCDLMHLSLPGGVVNCNSLRELSLLQTLLTSCPLIVNFIIEHCTELKKIELLTLQKIKSVSIWIKRNQRVKIRAPTLEHLSLVFRKSLLCWMLLIVRI